MKRKILSLLLGIAWTFSLLPAALAEDSVRPEPPEWISPEDYLIFPGDEVYQPEDWEGIGILREKARNGAGLGYHHGEWPNGLSVGTYYENALIGLKYIENAGEDREAVWTALNYTTGYFRRAMDGLRQEDRRWDGQSEEYYRVTVEYFRVNIPRGWQYVSHLNDRLFPALETLGMTLEDFYSYPFASLLTPELRAKLENAKAEYEREGKQKNDRITVWIDNKQVEMDTPPDVRDGRTMVPIRAVAEALGADVTWRGETGRIEMVRAGRSVVMELGSTGAMVDGSRVEMDVAPYAVEGRTLIPARYVAEFFGQKVEWDGTKRQVLITEDKSVAGDSNLEAWIVPMGAIYSGRMIAGEAGWFGGLRRGDTENGAKLARRMLEDSWGITDRESLMDTVYRMTFSGHNADFQAQAAGEGSKETEAAGNSLTQELSLRWGSRGILAWDLFRMAIVAEFGYTAGYVTYAEALSLGEPAARLLQANFSSWDEAYENYLDGYYWWSGEALPQDIWNTDRGRSYRIMKSNGGLLWFNDALFRQEIVSVPEFSRTD